LCSYVHTPPPCWVCQCSKQWGEQCPLRTPCSLLEAMPHWPWPFEAPPKLCVTLLELPKISIVDIAVVPCERPSPQVRLDAGATAALDAPFPDIEADRLEVCHAAPSTCKLRRPSPMCPRCAPNVPPMCPQCTSWPPMDVVTPCPSPDSQ
jgi:hypothetical protein